ncbi:MAG: signal peptide peptidase SppA, partial [Rubrivivax sp.]|nr:signal peptide peptidase SppA [Rubrivivax sp.]
RLLQDIGAAVAGTIGQPGDLRGTLLALGLAPALAPEIVQDLGWLAEVAERRQPFAAVTHCLCGVP